MGFQLQQISMGLGGLGRCNPRGSSDLRGWLQDMGDTKPSLEPCAIHTALPLSLHMNLLKQQL